jgi:formamidopyrimidine-DNA glycosylase
MPELPEIETIVRGLREPLMRRGVLRARLSPRGLYRRGSLRVAWLVGRRIVSVERVGKNAVFRFDPSGVLVVNLGMTGQLVLGAGGRRRPPGKHLHGRIDLEGGVELLYNDPRRFGRFYVAERCDFASDLNVGPDAFAVESRFLKKTWMERKAPIKALLLDQRIVSGIGNIYADEMLFHARVDPRTPARRAADRTGRILSSARTILQRAIDHGGSTFRDYRKHDGTKGEFQQFHAVYGRDGEACVRCGTTIRKIVIAGRGTHFCPRCQK